MRPSHTNGGYGVWSALANATLRGVRWLFGGRRGSLVRSGIFGIACLAAISTLVASAVTPPRPSAAVAAKPQRPDYLRPLGSLIRAGKLPPPALSGDSGAVGVPRGTPKPPVHANARTAAREGPEIARYQGTSGTLTAADIATLALEHGCAPQAAPTASAIAMAESGGSPSAQGDIALMNAVWDWSAGLWQVRGLRAERSTGALRDSIANQQVGHNTSAMYAISSGCTDWTPWSTYGNGDYARFLAIAGQAVHYVLAYYRTHGNHYPPVSAPDPTAAIPPQPMPQARAGSGSAKHPVRHRHHRHQRHQRHQSRKARVSINRSAAAPPRAPVARTTANPTHVKHVPLPIPTTRLPIPTLTRTRLPTLPVPLPTKSLSPPPLP